MLAPLFDRVVVVDWSAAAQPKRGADSVWIAAVDATGLTVTNPRTRSEALDQIAATARRGGATLLGVDFSLGFPHGTATALGLAGVPWESMWDLLEELVTDDERNTNNRFEVGALLNRRMGAGAGPFWGCPPKRATPTLTTTKPAADADRSQDAPGEWRTVERRLRTQGFRPFSAWQLLGAGAVGSQSLVGIAALARLRHRLDAEMFVWPFATGLSPVTAPCTGAAGALGTPGPTRVVVAEVWPSLWPIDVPLGEVKDAVQVADTARRLADMDVAGDLAELFSPQIGDTDMETVTTEEGWILGVR